MFDRFDAGARQAVIDAARLARGAGSDRVGTEHLLAAVVGLGADPTLDAEAILGAAPAAGLRQADPPRTAAGHLPFTRELKLAMFLALRHSERRDRAITITHLLAGVVAVCDSAAVQALTAIGADPAALRRQLGVDEQDIMPALFTLPQLGTPPPLPTRGGLVRWIVGVLLTYAVLCTPLVAAGAVIGGPSPWSASSASLHCSGCR